MVLTARDYQRDDGRVDDELNKVTCRGGLHRSKKVSELGRFVGVLVPEVEEHVAFGGESFAGHKKMLNVARDMFTRTEETVSILVGRGPVSTVPVRSIATAHHSRNCYGLVDFIWIILTS